MQRNEVSLYTGVLSTPCVIHNVARIKNAFPSLPEGFYDVFAERIKDCGFTDERLTDAVNNVIDNCLYPTPTIGQFISFDKRIKVYKYSDIVKMVDDGDITAFEKYDRVFIDGLPVAVWVHINDIVKYGLKTKQDET